MTQLSASRHSVTPLQHHHRTVIPNEARNLSSITGVLRCPAPAKITQLSSRPQWRDRGNISTNLKSHQRFANLRVLCVSALDSSSRKLHAFLRTSLARHQSSAQRPTRLPRTPTTPPPKSTKHSPPNRVIFPPSNAHSAIFFTISQPTDAPIPTVGPPISSSCHPRIGSSIGPSPNSPKIFTTFSSR